MLNQFNNWSPSFSYLAFNEAELVTTVLEQVTTDQGQRSKIAFEHLYQMLQILTEWKMPAPVILAALASHFPENSPPFSPDQLNFFRAKILKMICDFRGLSQTSVALGDPDFRKARRVNRLRQLFVGAYTDLELVLLCLADHLVKMKSIELLERREARLLAEENEDIFLPLVEMLGLWQLRRDLGDQSLKTLNPKKAWDKISQRQELVKEEHKQCYKSIKEALTPELDMAGIKGEICFHFSPASSLYRRIRRGESLDKLARKVKIDIVVDTEDACYRALGLVHQKYSPLAGRTSAGSYFRELIASPKFNGYRALVTTVGYQKPGEFKKEKLIPIEFRIYTREMEQTNAYGIIAVKFLSGSPIRIKNAWWEEEQIVKFVGAHPIDADGTAEIFVFTPTGQVYQLPQGSTPIDYAYRVHSEIGNHCKRMWINGRPATFTQKLHNGDLVEIEVDPRYPGPDVKWERAVQTSTARKQIKRALKQDRMTHKGREIIDNILNNEVEAYGLPEIPREKVDKFLERTARYFNYSDLTALYADLATPRQASRSPKPSPNRIVARLIAAQLADYVVKANGEALGISKERIKFAQYQHDKKPCRVTPGVEIVGRLSRQGTKHECLVVYRCDCPEAPQGQAAIPLSWLGQRRPGEPVRVNIQAVDRDRLLDDILHIIYELYEDGLYLLGVQANVSRDRSTRIQLTIDAPDYRPVERLAEKFEQLRASGKIDGFLIDALSPIEKMLLVEPDALPNPYTPGLARDRRIFKGRTEEIGKIMSCLNGTQNSVILYGLNRVGKSSLLHYLKDYVVEEYNFVPVLINMPGLGERSENHFWLRLATQMNEAIAHLYRSKKGPVRSAGVKIKHDAFGGFRDWLEEAKTAIKGRRWLIMIDELNEVDELWTPNEAQSIIYRLKSLVENQPEVAFIFCFQETLYKEAASTRDPLRDAARKRYKVVSWPLLRAGVGVRLDYLDRQAAEKLIREPMGKMLQYDDDVVDRMIYLTACHPYHLQNMLHHLVSRAGKDKRKFETVKVTSVDLEAVIPQLLNNGEQFFYDFLREYYGFARRAVLSALAYISTSDYKGPTIIKLEEVLKQKEVKAPQARLIQTLEQLRDAGVVVRREAAGQTQYFIRVPLFAQWLLENRPYHLISPQR